MPTQQELENALYSAVDNRNNIEALIDNMLTTSNKFYEVIEEFNAFNKHNGTQFDTVPLYKSIDELDETIVVANGSLAQAKLVVIDADRALSDFKRDHKATLLKNREGAIHMESKYTATEITFSTLDVNKAIAKLENGTIVEVIFKPDSDVIDFELTKSYFHTASNVW